MQEDDQFDTLEALARSIIEQGHVIEVPDPFFYGDDSKAACDSCGARLTISISQGQYGTGDTISADVEERLLEKCSPLPTHVFRWTLEGEDEEDQDESEEDEDEEPPI